MALAPRAVQNMPDCLSRLPITDLDPLQSRPILRKILLPETRIAHAGGITFKTVGFDPQCFRQLGALIGAGSIPSELESKRPSEQLGHF